MERYAAALRQAQETSRRGKILGKFKASPDQPSQVVIDIEEVYGRMLAFSRVRSKELLYENLAAPLIRETEGYYAFEVVPDMIRRTFEIPNRLDPETD